jgi:hypothetical protein
MMVGVWRAACKKAQASRQTPTIIPNYQRSEKSGQSSETESLNLATTGKNSCR